MRPDKATAANNESFHVARPFPLLLQPVATSQSQSLFCLKALPPDPREVHQRGSGRGPA